MGMVLLPLPALVKLLSNRGDLWREAMEVVP